MKTIALHAPTGKCEIMIGEKLANAGRYIGAKKAVIVTDRNVRKYHGSAFPPYDVIEIGLGEGNKTLRTLEQVYKRFLELEIERSSFVLAIGGGIVCDVAGYAASEYLRGLEFGFVPTTLLAQVDAAIGGKNGVNFMGYKNLIGTIRQPKFCICDSSVLKTLPAAEVRNGFAEAIKSAAIADAALFALLESKTDEALRLDAGVVERVVESCVAIKVGIVERDEKESFERMLLNFGHTFGHALEKTTGIPHGEAIAIGMMAAAELSVAKGMLARADADRLRELVVAFGLPVSCSMDREGVIDAIRKDKKRRSGSINMVLLEAIGKAKISEVGIDELANALKDMH